MQNSYKIGGGEVRAFFHSGDGGQILSVLPELNMVIVATAGNYGTNSNKTYDDILESYILPAVSLESPAGR